MKRKSVFYLYACFMIMIIIPAAVFSENIRVSIEPFPPLINEDKTGYSVNLLKEIEKITDLKFNITMTPYNRAKIELQSNRADLIGHTPHNSNSLSR